MNLPNFLRGIKLSSMNPSVISGLLRILGYKVDNQVVDEIFSVIALVAQSNTELTINDLLIDESFINIVERIKQYNSNQGAVLEDGFCQCPYCGRTDHLSAFAPKLFKE